MRTVCSILSVPLALGGVAFLGVFYANPHAPEYLLGLGSILCGLGCLAVWYGTK